MTAVLRPLLAVIKRVLSGTSDEIQRANRRQPLRGGVHENPGGGWSDLQEEVRHADQPGRGLLRKHQQRSRGHIPGRPCGSVRHVRVVHDAGHRGGAQLDRLRALDRGPCAVGPRQGGVHQAEADPQGERPSSARGAALLERDSRDPGQHPRGPPVGQLSSAQHRPADGRDLPAAGQSGPADHPVPKEHAQQVHAGEGEQRGRAGHPCGDRLGQVQSPRGRPQQHHRTPGWRRPSGAGGRLPVGEAGFAYSSLFPQQSSSDLQPSLTASHRRPSGDLRGEPSRLSHHLLRQCAYGPLSSLPSALYMRAFRASRLLPDASPCIPVL